MIARLTKNSSGLPTAAAEFGVSCHEFSAKGANY